MVDQADTPKRPLKGAALMVGSSLMFVIAGLAVKLAAEEMSNAMIVFFRNAIAALVLAPWVWRDLSPRSDGVYGMHLLRTISSVAGVYCFFGAIARIPLADAALLQFTSPIFVPVLALLILRIPLDRRAVAAAVTGFVGIAIVLDPTGVSLTFGSALGLGAGLFSALSVISIWILSGRESAARIVFFYSLFGTFFSAIPLIWAWQTPNPLILVTLCVIGLASAVAQVLFTAAISTANPDQVITLSYSGVVWAGLAGYVFWGEPLGTNLLVGSVVVILACLFASRFQPKTID